MPDFESPPQLKRSDRNVQLIMKKQRHHRTVTMHNEHDVQPPKDGYDERIHTVMTMMNNQDPEVMITRTTAIDKECQ